MHSEENRDASKNQTFFPTPTTVSYLLNVTLSFTDVLALVQSFHSYVKHLAEFNQPFFTLGQQHTFDFCAFPHAQYGFLFSANIDHCQ